MTTSSQCVDTMTGPYRATANNSPCQLCDGAQCGACIELADIETQIEVLHSRLRDLHEKRRVARSKRNHIHNRLIHQLPLEIVSLIFTLCLSPRPSDGSGFISEHFPFALSAVCQAWRAFALSTPSLWSNPISIKVYTPNIAHINHRLMYSGSLPISIRLASNLSTHGANTDGLMKSAEVLRLVKKNLHRTHFLCLHGSDELIEWFDSTSNCPTSTPLLQEFHVHCPDADFGYSDLRLSTMLPRSQTVFATSCCLDSLDLDRNNVSNSTIGDITVWCSLMLLSRSGRRRVSLDIDEDDPRFNLPDTPIVHQSIRYLALSGWETANIIFSCTTINSLDTLVIELFNKFLLMAPKFVDFLRGSSCPLRCLEMTFIGPFTADTLISVLSEIPTLQELDLADNFNLAFLGAGAEFIEPLLERLSLTQSSGDGTFLPRLHRFKYKGRPKPSVTLLLDIFPGFVDSPHVVTVPSHSTRSLQTVDVGIVTFDADLESWGLPEIPKSQILHILQLRKNGKHFSFTYFTESEEIDLVEYSMRRQSLR
jgi:hypothetical protein